MTTEQPTRPQLHVSMLDMLSRCGVSFQRRYGARFGCWHEEEIKPPSIALATGISVHKAVGADLTHKMENAVLLEREQIKDIARDQFMGQSEAGLMLSNNEAVDLRRSIGAAVDQTVALAVLHHDEVAPQIEPLAVEEPFVITMNGYPYDLAGMKDVREVDCIRDTKTARAKPSNGAAQSMQMACYSLDEKIQRGSLPKLVKLDFLVKTKTPKAITIEAVPTMEWIKPFLRRLEQAIKIIESVKEGRGHFTPANAGDWCCRAAYCGYHVNCPYFSGRD